MFFFRFQIYTRIIRSTSLCLPLRHGTSTISLPRNIVKPLNLSIIIVQMMFVLLQDDIGSPLMCKNEESGAWYAQGNIILHEYSNHIYHSQQTKYFLGKALPK